MDDMGPISLVRGAACNPLTMNNFIGETVEPEEDRRQRVKKGMRKLCQLPLHAAANPLKCLTSAAQCLDLKKFAFFYCTSFVIKKVQHRNFAFFFQQLSTFSFLIVQ